MATVHQIIPRIEGMVGTVAQGNAAVQIWAECVKTMLRSSTFRGLDDLEFDFVPLITDVGIVVSTSATHLIADCWEISGDLGTDTSAFCGFTDADSDTIVLTTALSTQEDVVVTFPVNDLATSTINEFYPHIYFAGASGVEAAPGTYAQTGMGLAIGLTAWSDGNDSNAPTAASIRAFVLYRT